MMPEPSLAMLHLLMERMLEQQRQVMNRLERVERALLAGQRLILDRTETDTDIQHALDAITRRAEALEGWLVVLTLDKCIEWVDDFAELSKEEEADSRVFLLECEHDPWQPYQRPRARRHSVAWVPLGLAWWLGSGQRLYAAQRAHSALWQ